MTTQAEYAEAADLCADEALVSRHQAGNPALDVAGHTLEAHRWELAARVLRALADGAVLCKPITEWNGGIVNGDRHMVITYTPLDPQP